MTSTIHLLLILSCYISVAHCTIDDAFVEASNEFAVRLYKQLAPEDGNIFFCPICLTSSLTLLLEGSRFKTEAELNVSLGYKSNRLDREAIRRAFRSVYQRIKETDCLSESVTALFSQKDQNESKDNLPRELQGIYNTQIRQVDFVESRQEALWEINELVKTGTRGHVKRLLERIENKPQMLLINAFHYSTKFVGVFGDQRPRKQRFFNHGVTDHELFVNMMSKRKGVFRVADSYDFRALELPCGEQNKRNTTLWLLLPHKTGSLSAVEDSLSTGTFDYVRRNLDPAEIQISIPKIRFNYVKEISKELQLMGIQRAFSSQDADFEAFNKKENLALSQVLLKSIGEITEPRFHYQSWNSSFSDTEKSTESNVTSKSVEPFIADHPFLLTVIDEKSGLIIYIGRVYEF